MEIVSESKVNQFHYIQIIWSICDKVGLVHNVKCHVVQLHKKYIYTYIYVCICMYV